MKLQLLYSILLFVTFGCQAQEEVITGDFLTGVWQPVVSQDIDFDVWFYVEDGYISGQYCAMTSNASRIDCKEDEDDVDCGLHAPFLIDQKTHAVDVTSCYSFKKGTVELTRQGDHLLWKLNQFDGRHLYDHLMPAEVLLKKAAEDPFE